jgi:hypothetical protein
MATSDSTTFSSRGIDYDLQSCLDYNPQPFTVDDIERVLAVWEGENDGDDWRWVLLLKDGRYAFLQGGCDYTGWDCQSWATSAFDDTPEDSAKRALGDIESDYGSDPQVVYESLLRQITEGKNKTWREQKDDEFGVQS